MRCHHYYHYHCHYHHHCHYRDHYHCHYHCHCHGHCHYHCHHHSHCHYYHHHHHHCCFTITIMLQELESLKGWKYIVSLLLEAGDIALPIFRNCMARVSAAISWLLVKLIGRALGLIYRGVKQSLVPQRQKHRKGQTVSTDTEGPQAWMPKFS